jgi:stress response protein SCP2
LGSVGNATLAEFKISENGGDHTALIVGTITDAGNTYKFTADGRYINGDINEVVASI